MNVFITFIDEFGLKIHIGREIRVSPIERLQFNQTDM